MTEICIIVALSEKNRVIGKDGKLPWPNISADMRHFKDCTKTHPVIMGRNTFESIVESLKKPLPNRQNIVVTHRRLTIPGVVVKHDLPEAIELGKRLDEEKVFIIGGGEIYKQALELPLREQISRLYLTIVEGDFSGDTFFPDYSGFKKIKEEEGEEKGIKYKFVELI